MTCRLVSGMCTIACVDVVTANVCGVTVATQQLTMPCS
jgi:hypothetical protein